MSLESTDEKDAGELVLASLKLTERLMSVVDSHHTHASADDFSLPASSAVQGTAYHKCVGLFIVNLICSHLLQHYVFNSCVSPCELTVFYFVVYFLFIVVCFCCVVVFVSELVHMIRFWGHRSHLQHDRSRVKI